MRISRLLTAFALALSFAGFTAAEQGDLRQRVSRVAQKYSLDEQELYLAVESVQSTGQLPAKWITKAEASRLGWRPGRPLGRVAPGKSIGGDRFGNRERRLPAKAGRNWFEADLDYRGGKRNARRLLYSNDRWVFVTVDHYQTFERIIP